MSAYYPVGIRVMAVQDRWIGLHTHASSIAATMLSTVNEYAHFAFLPYSGVGVSFVRAILTAMNCLFSLALFSISHHCQFRSPIST